MVSRIVILAAIILAVAVAAQGNCWNTPEDCQEDECCVRLTNLIGICKKMKQEAETCGTKIVKQPFKDHVYLVQCPCADGLTCVKKEGIVGVVAGTCESWAAETPDETGGGEE